MEDNDTSSMSAAAIIRCLSCRLNIYTQQEKDEHYKGAWHRYNVKRRAVGLLSMSKEDFDLKMKRLKEASAEKLAVAFKCDLCSKKFKSEGMMRQHLVTKKHKLNVKRKLSMDSNAGSTVGSESGDIISAKKMREEDYIKKIVVRENKKLVTQSPMVPIPLQWCLFCEKGDFESIEESLEHMHQAHGFEIPYISKLTSLEGCLIMAGKIIGEGHACTSCWKSFSSKEGAWQHMGAVGHQTFDVNAREETLFDPYYDWTQAEQSISSDGISQHLVVPKRQLLCVNEWGELEFDDGQIALPRNAVKYHHHPKMQRLYDPNSKRVNLGMKMINGRPDVQHHTGPSRKELQYELARKINMNVYRRQNKASQMFFRLQNPK